MYNFCSVADGARFAHREADFAYQVCYVSVVCFSSHLLQLSIGNSFGQPIDQLTC